MQAVDALRGIARGNPNIAYLYAAIGYSTQALGHITFKSLSKVMSPFQVFFIRSFALFCLNSIFLRRAKLSPYIKSRQTFNQILKILCFFSSFAVITHYCVNHIPVSTVSSLNNIAPIFIFFVERFYHNTPLNTTNLAFTLLSFIGVILVLQPQYLFHQENISEMQSFEIYSLMVIFAAFCNSMAMFRIHSIRAKVNTLVNLHYTYMGHMTVCAVLSIFQPPTIKVEQVDLTFILSFILLVFLSLTTQYLIYMATTLIKPSHTMPFGYLGLIVGFTADILYFGSSFNLLSVVGMILTSVGLLSKLFL